MPRRKKETLVHLDLEALAKETAEAKSGSDESDNATVGQLLKTTREKRKLTLTEVGERLRIKEIYLEALEQGSYRAFPGLAYGIGFLRTYATFLGLDAKNVIDRYKQETADMAREPLDMPVAENHNVVPSKKVVWWSIGALLVVYCVWSGVQYLLKPVSMEPVAPVMTTETPVEAIVSEAAEPVLEAPVESDTLLDNTDIDEPQMRAHTPEKPKTANKIYGTGDGKKMAFVANAEVWIEIKDGAKVLFSKVLQAGDRYQPGSDSETWALKTGNAGALDVFVNGQNKGALGESGTIKSDVVLDVETFMEH